MRKLYESIFKEAKFNVSYNDIAKHTGRQDGGAADVIYGTLENINDGMPAQKAFLDACEDQNFYGSRSDTVEARTKISKILKDKFKVTVDPVKGF